MGAATHHRLAALLVTAAISLTACGPPSKSNIPTSPVSGGTVTDEATFVGGEPAHIDPALAVDSATSQIAGLVYEGLTKTDAQGNVQPAVATNYTVSGDNNVWTFTLRRDAKFSDGSAVTASSFASAWQRARQVRQKLGIDQGLLNVVADAKPDDAAATLQVSLTRAAPDFPAMASLPLFAPLPSSANANVSDGRSELEAGAMVGDGAFKMSAPWQHGNNITISRSDVYWGKKTYLDSVVFKFPKDNAAAGTDYNQGVNDVAKLDPTQIKNVAPNNLERLVNDSQSATEYWAFDMSNPSVGGPDNLLLRQAIARTIDRKSMAVNLFHGAFQAADGWVPFTAPGYQASLQSNNRNVEVAKDLLKQWGKTPPVIDVAYPSDNVMATAEAPQIKSELADIGLSSNLKPLDAGAFTAAVKAGQVNFFYGTWTARYQSFDTVMAPFVSTSPDNVFHYANPAVDAQLNLARHAVNAADRDSADQAAQNAMQADVPVIPLEWLSSTLIRSARLQDLHVNPLGQVQYASAWVAPEVR